jgi:hypothetical protein
MKLVQVCVLWMAFAVAEAAGPAAPADLQLEMRVAANAAEHADIVQKAMATQGSVVEEAGKVVARWVPIAPSVLKAAKEPSALVVRGRSELLVLVSPDDVADHVRGWEPTQDEYGRDALVITFTEAGYEQLFQFSTAHLGETGVIIANGQARYVAKMRSGLRGPILMPTGEQADLKALAETPWNADAVLIPVWLVIAVLLCVLGGIVLVVFPTAGWRSPRCPTVLSMVVAIAGAVAGAATLGVHSSYGSVQGVVVRNLRIGLVNLLGGAVGGGLVGWFGARVLWAAFRRAGHNAFRMMRSLAHRLRRATASRC